MTTLTFAGSSSQPGNSTSKRATEAVVLLLLTALVIAGYMLVSYTPPFCLRCDIKGTLRP